MYQPGETSQLLGFPASTLRHYAKVYRDYLSPGTQGRHRVYNDRDLATLQRIRELSDQGYTVNEIKTTLGEEIIIDEQEEQPGSEIMVPLPKILFQVSETLTDLQDQQTELLNEIKSLRQELDARQKLSFWQRLFGKRPPQD